MERINAKSLRTCAGHMFAFQSVSSASSNLSGFTVSRFRGFTVSRFHGFTVSRFRGFTVSRFHGFAVSRFHGFTVSSASSNLSGFTVSRFHGFTVSFASSNLSGRGFTHSSLASCSRDAPAYFCSLREQPFSSTFPK
jgi:hypothetical protein